MISFKLLCIPFFGVVLLHLSLANTCGEKYAFKVVVLNKSPYDSASAKDKNLSRDQCMTKCLSTFGANCKMFFYNDESQTCRMYNSSVTCVRLIAEDGTTGLAEVTNSAGSLAACSNPGVSLIDVPGLDNPIHGYFDSLGWLVIQRRTDGSENFDKTFLEYENGFGNFTNEFWLGNKIVHLITSQKPHEVQVDVAIGSRKISKRYSNFSLASSSARYRLSVDATDQFQFNNGMRFTTKYEDNDSHDAMNCATYYGGGWWYAACGSTYLNGRQPCSGSICSRWPISPREILNNPDRTEIKIRPMGP